MANTTSSIMGPALTPSGRSSTQGRSACWICSPHLSKSSMIPIWNPTLSSSPRQLFKPIVNKRPNMETSSRQALLLLFYGLSISSLSKTISFFRRMSSEIRCRLPRTWRTITAITLTPWSPSTMWTTYFSSWCTRLTYWNGNRNGYQPNGWPPAPRNKWERNRNITFCIQTTLIAWSIIKNLFERRWCFRCVSMCRKYSFFLNKTHAKNPTTHGRGQF